TSAVGLIVASVPSPTGTSPLFLQLFLQLVEEAPVGALGNDLLRAALDDSDFMKAKRIEPHGVLWIVFPPLPVHDLLHGLDGGVGALYIALSRRETVRRARAPARRYSMP